MVEANMIGAYGPWAAGLIGEGPARLSFRREEFGDLQAWRTAARKRYREALLQPPTGGVPQATVEHQWDYDGLTIEHLRWQLPYGPPTEAYLLKPKGAKGRLPAVLGLHDHGGNKYFGKRKITRVSDDVHPVMQAHQQQSYGGLAWANQLAKRGYVVLVHDTFTFGSRRVRVGNLPAAIKHDLLEEKAPESPAEIRQYNTFAGKHESIMAKSLFCAGTTWPGVFTAEDQRALDVLCARDDVDADRVGCGGLSGGGLRTVYLGGLDPRIRVAVCVGMMTTWRDYLLHKAYTHTWMIYLPGLPPELDYPEILGLRAPLATLVLNNNQDPLFTLPEMQRADVMLTEVFRKAGKPERYQARFYDGPHKFNQPMQADAFAWLDRWLKG